MTRILVVDDNEDNLYLMEVLLGANDYEVEVAKHGADALAKAKKSRPDIVVSDLLMPVMDGYTLLRRWKADPDLKQVPFVVYTATYTDPEDERLAFSLGADGFVLKPSEPEAFLEKLRDARQRTSSSRHSDLDPNEHKEERLREYSETLIRKLEHRTLQLEESNRKLQEDIIARQSVELALRESEERFRQVAENTDEVFWLSETQRPHLFYVSPRFEEVWGRPTKSLYDSPDSWTELVHPHDRERLNDSLLEYASGNWDQTYRIVRDDGKVRWIRSRAFPVRDESGAVYRVAGMSRDVTQYRLLEEQFRQAQKMEAIGRLAGGISHDFNNLLSIILTYASFARAAAEPESQLRADIEELHQAGKRAAALTRQLLAFSRQQMLEPRVLNLSELVRGLERMLHRLVTENIDFNVITQPSSGDDSTYNVYADPSQIEQIIMNLVINAVDAMPEGGNLTLELRRAPLTAEHIEMYPGAVPGSYAVLTVSDTGTGMDDATRERIFEPFFTTKEVGHGTGLGLSTVFGIVKQSQGHISVSSEPGLGTTFKVYLPCTDQAQVDGQFLSVAQGTYHGTETVLLVEDDEHVRHAHEAILSRYGYRVIATRNGAEGQDLANAFDGTIHLLLTDVVMPKMGGYELAELLMSRRPDMKVLYVSGYSKSAAARPGQADGKSSFVQKPTTPKTLLGKIREMFDAVTPP